jgi:probable F420-dependent oxidoreductase
MTTLGYLAGVTERVHLLSHVYVLPHRHPLMTAKAFLTLDAVSRGRAILGVGAGHLEAEFEVLGTDFAGRGAVTDEAIDVVRTAFQDEFVHHKGERYTIDGAGLRPRPTRPGGPPIWVGGSSPRALRRAADQGDGWLPQGPPKQGMKLAVEGLLERRAETRPGEPMDIGAMTGPLYVGDPPFEVEPYCVKGPPEKVAAIIRKLAVPGVNHMQVRFRSRSTDELLDQIDAFAADVMPLVAKGESG